MSEFCKGAYVRYHGPQNPFNGQLGQVVGHYNKKPNRQDPPMVKVRFLNGNEYGCYVQFLTRVYKRTAALEIAKLAFNLPTQQET